MISPWMGLPPAIVASSSWAAVPVKTFTALRLSERVAEENGGKARILFLVPSIFLLLQTLNEWTVQGCLDMRTFAACSDSKISRKAEDIATYDREVLVSIRGGEIVQQFELGEPVMGSTSYSPPTSRYLEFTMPKRKSLGDSAEL